MKIPFRSTHNAFSCPVSSPFIEFGCFMHTIDMWTTSMMNAELSPRVNFPRSEKTVKDYERLCIDIQTDLLYKY